MPAPFVDDNDELCVECVEGVRGIKRRRAHLRIKMKGGRKKGDE